MKTCPASVWQTRRSDASSRGFLGNGRLRCHSIAVLWSPMSTAPDNRAQQNDRLMVIGRSRSRLRLVVVCQLSNRRLRCVGCAFSAKALAHAGTEPRDRRTLSERFVPVKSHSSPCEDTKGYVRTPRGIQSRHAWPIPCAACSSWGRRETLLACRPPAARRDVRNLRTSTQRPDKHAGTRSSTGTTLGRALYLPVYSVPGNGRRGKTRECVREICVARFLCQTDTSPLKYSDYS